ncbi:Indolethylamine N-methyltransferase, partial [Stegodyphus mimosarum]
MANKEFNVKEDYKKNLDPKKFNEFTLQGLRDEKSQNKFDFWLACLYEFFTLEEFRGERMLDLGSGPSVHNVATACAYVPNVILSDFSETNCERLRKWLRNDPDCIDCSLYLQRVAKAERRNDVEEACKEIEERIRSSVKEVIPCDVLDDQVIPEEYSKSRFDSILTSLTFECAAASWDSYSKILGRVNHLLRPGGKLLMLGATGCSYWQVGDNWFFCLPMEETDVQRALQINGFGDIRWKLLEEPDDELVFNCKKLYFVVSTKL